MTAVCFHGTALDAAVRDLVRLASRFSMIGPRLELRTRAFFPQMIDRTVRPSSIYIAVVRLACAEIESEVRRPYYYANGLISTLLLALN